MPFKQWTCNLTYLYHFLRLKPFHPWPLLRASLLSFAYFSAAILSAASCFLLASDLCDTCWCVLSWWVHGLKIFKKTKKKKMYRPSKTPRIGTHLSIACVFRIGFFFGLRFGYSSSSSSSSSPLLLAPLVVGVGVLSSTLLASSCGWADDIRASPFECFGFGEGSHSTHTWKNGLQGCLFVRL